MFHKQEELEEYFLNKLFDICTCKYLSCTGAELRMQYGRIKFLMGQRPDRLLRDLTKLTEEQQSNTTMQMAKI